MKISYNWLKDYLSTDLSPTEISEILTDTGLEVDGIEKIEGIKGGLQGVFVGEVLTSEKHPDADKLKITTVTVGGEPLQIVCGAPNVEVGQKVICATIGAILYPSPEEPFKIKASKIRGVESFGMLCAEDELGLGISHEGILVLPANAKVGTPAAEYFELEDDFQIEIGLTPNRADAMGHIGVARDLVAYLNFHKELNLKVNFPKVDPIRSTSNNLIISVDVTEKELCPKYLGVTISNVVVEPSPNWLQKRLISVGLTPINSIVDCTNYVMRELGTPLHAFDTSKLNNKIIVKRATTGDKLTTLDGVERTLHQDDLMICNATDYLAIAGVFGGLDSGISDKTTSVFIESAYFNPISVRKTAKRHALNTDASFRYERGVDPQLTMYALERVVALIRSISGGEVSMEVAKNEFDLFEPIQIVFSVAKCNAVIGKLIDEYSIEKIITELDFKILEKNQGNWKIEIPSYRVDVTREIDVIEEVLRIYGFNNVDIPEKLNTTITLSQKPDVERIQSIISEFLVGLGCNEMMCNSLTTSVYIDKFGNDNFSSTKNVSMLNPLSQELDVMRQSLIFSSLEAVAHNQNRQTSDIRLFEFGKTYQKIGNTYKENKRLLLAISGKKLNEQWNNSSEKSNFFTLKGISFALLERLGLENFLTENPISESLLEDGVELSVLKQTIGQIGWVSGKMRKHFGIKQAVFIADLDWDALITQLKLVKINYKELPKTFEVRRDFSLLLDTAINYQSIEKLALGVDRKILKRMNLFDVYEGNNLESGKKSYAVSFYFQDNELTLKDEQIEKIMLKIKSELVSKLNAQLR